MAIGRDTRFTWLGHAGVEIATPGGQVVLVDPWYGNPNSPHAVDAQERCDVLCVTHGHFDHFDADTLSLARRLHPTMPCVHELSLYLLAQLGDATEVIGMNAGGTVETHGIRFTMVPAAHSSGDLMGGTDVRYFGEPVGFVLELENGFRVYDAGDTTVFGDMALIRELYAPDLAILPDRRPLHDGPGGGRGRGRPPRGARRAAGPLGDVPDPDGHAGSRAGRAGRAWHRRAGPRLEARGDRRLGPRPPAPQMEVRGGRDEADDQAGQVVDHIAARRSGEREELSRSGVLTRPWLAHPRSVGGARIRAARGLRMDVHRPRPLAHPRTRLPVPGIRPRARC